MHLGLLSLSRRLESLRRPALVAGLVGLRLEADFRNQYSAYDATVKIATFNVNNINKRLPNLLAWLKTSQPDVVCLQELKSTDAVFPADILNSVGYGAVWRGERSWNGVAILARGVDPVLISYRQHHVSLRPR